MSAPLYAVGDTLEVHAVDWPVAAGVVKKIQPSKCADYAYRYFLTMPNGKVSYFYEPEVRPIPEEM